MVIYVEDKQNDKYTAVDFALCEQIVCFLIKLFELTFATTFVNGLPRYSLFTLRIQEKFKRCLDPILDINK